MLGSFSPITLGNDDGNGDYDETIPQFSTCGVQEGRVEEARALVRISVSPRAG